jgi:hypothetical protein
MPAPEILSGLMEVRLHNDQGHAAYLLGQNSLDGWWYFFPVAVAVKTPLGFLLLALLGTGAALALPSKYAPWQLRAAGVCGLAIIAACMPAHLNIGVRYTLPAFPMLAVAAAYGAMILFRRGRWKWLAVGLLAWAGTASLLAHPDYIPYFNELAGRHPERILVDSDLDWGQDMQRLSTRLRQLGVEHVYLACHYSGDDSKLGLPEWDGLPPFQPVKGWVAVSFTKLETYGWYAAREMRRPGRAYDWLNAYRPAERVGKSILLYYVP